MLSLTLGHLLEQGDLHPSDTPAEHRVGVRVISTPPTRTNIRLELLCINNHTAQSRPLHSSWLFFRSVFGGEPTAGALQVQPG